MKRKISVKLLCVALCAALLMPCAVLFASAETVTIVDETERAKMLEMFNASANGIKSLRPRMDMESHIAMGEATVSTNGSAEALDNNGGF